MNGLQHIAGLALALLAQTTILLAVVLIASKRLRDSGPAATSLTFKAALIGVVALCAVSLIPIPQNHSLIRVSPPPPITLFTAPQAEVQSSSHNQSERPAEPVSKPQVAEAAAHEKIPSTIESHPPQPKTRSITLSAAIIDLWSAGTCLILAWLVWAQVGLLSLRFRSKLSTQGRAFDNLQALCQSRGLRTPELRIHPSVDGPFLTGIIRPAILMNSRAIEELDASTLELIFEHELAHLHSHDCAWRLIERLVCAVLWPQPLLWKLCVRLDQYSEELCDQMVIANSSSRRQYADCLLNLAKGSSYGPAERSLGVGVVPFRSEIGKRIARIMDSSQRFTTHLSSRSRVAIAGLTAAMAVAIVLAVSGGMPLSQDGLKPYPYDKRSDPKAVQLFEEMRATYHGLSTFSATIKTSAHRTDWPPTFHAERESIELVYKRPSSAFARATNDANRVVTKTVYVENHKAIVTWPKNPKIYQVAQGPAGSGRAGNADFEKSALYELWGHGMLGPFAIMELIETTVVQPGIAGPVLTLGADTVIHGEPVSTLITESHHQATGQTTEESQKTIYTIGKSDHLIRTYKEVSRFGDPAISITRTEDYLKIRVNPQVEDRVFAFHAPAGAVATKPDWGQPTLSAGAQSVLDKAKEAYRGLKSISFTAQNNQGTLTVAAERPNRARLTLKFDAADARTWHLVADGVNVYSWVGENARRFYLAPVTTDRIVRFGATRMGNGDFGDFLETVGWALGDESPNHRMLMSGDIELGPSGFVNGIPVDKIICTRATHDNDGMPKKGEFVSETYSFGQKDHLLYQHQWRRREILHGRVLHYESSETITHLEVNRPFSDDFAFRPGSMTRANSLAEFEQSTRPASEIEVGQPFPQINAEDSYGKPFSVAQYRGKVLLVHVCNWKAELPKIATLSRKYRARGFEFVEIACDPVWTPLSFDRYLKNSGIQARYLFDKQGESSGFENLPRLRTWPNAYLIGRDGRVLGTRLQIEHLEPLLKKSLGIAH